MKQIVQDDKKITYLKIGSLIILSLLTYLWTINLPIIGDGLMHLTDNTDLTFKNILKSFWTFDGIGKPGYSPTLRFHRPIFDEIIVELIKIISQNNVIIIHLVSVMVHSVIVIISYFLGQEIFEDKFKPFALAIVFNFSLAYFSPMYEFGLSFSLWLTGFFLLAFYYTIRYVKYETKTDLILAILWSFFCLFTKESAMTIGVALSWYVLISEMIDKKKITSKTIIYGCVQFVILLFYLCTRYNKLGSLFTVAAGLDTGTISLKDVVFKIVGYFLFSLNIPNNVFERYMQPFAIEMILPCALLILVLGITLFLYIRNSENKKLFIIECLTYLGMFGILVVPIFKTTRNSPYYADLVIIVILVMVFSWINIERKINRVCLMIFGICYISLFVLSANIMVQKNSGYYLSVISNEAKDRMEKLVQVESKIDKDMVLFSANWIRNSDEFFTYNHGKYGSFYYNIDKNKEVGIINVNNCNADAVFIDYYTDVDRQDSIILIYSKESVDTKMVQVQYNAEINDIVSVGFSYNGNYYYSCIDVAYKNTWSEDNSLFFVIPQECTMDVVGVECSVIYWEENDD